MQARSVSFCGRFLFGEDALCKAADFCKEIGAPVTAEQIGLTDQAVIRTLTSQEDQRILAS